MVLVVTFSDRGDLKGSTSGSIGDCDLQMGRWKRSRLTFKINADKPIQLVGQLQPGMQQQQHSIHTRCIPSLWPMTTPHSDAMFLPMACAVRELDGHTILGRWKSSVVHGAEGTWAVSFSNEVKAKRGKDAINLAAIKFEP
jgi:hypothetical protein